MLFITIFRLMAPLLSLVIMTLGNGLFLTLLTIRLHNDGVSSWIIGAVSGAYYAGLVVGSFNIERFIVRVGHIRAYAAFASFLAAVIMVQGLWVNPVAWIMFRFIGGYCMAALFIVIESWLISASDINMRGKILSVYMIALYGAQASGQFLLKLSNPESIIPFCLTTILTTLSVVPLAMTYAGSPKIEEPSALSVMKLYRISPSGVFGCFCAGLILGSLYGLLPLYITEVFKTINDVALFMGLTIFGGMALQYPLGHLSDYFNRRNVIISVCIFTMITAAAVLILPHHLRMVFMMLMFILGGFTFTLYPLCINYVCDYVDTKDIVAATQGLLLAYGVGASIGPLIAPGFIYWMGPSGLFVFFLICAILMGGLFTLRRKTKPSKTPEEQQDYVTLSRTTPVANELSPRLEEGGSPDEYPI